MQHIDPFIKTHIHPTMHAIVKKKLGEYHKIPTSFIVKGFIFRQQNDEIIWATIPDDISHDVPKT